jgi:hypothetical protein
MTQRIFLVCCSAAAVALALTNCDKAFGQLPDLEYVVPQDGSGAPDPSLIDARLDDGLGSTTQGFQTYQYPNELYLKHILYPDTIDGRSVLRRKTAALGGLDEGGIRTKGNMGILDPALGGPSQHGSNTNTWNNAAMNAISANGFRGSVKIWLPDIPNKGTPVEHNLGEDPPDHFAFNGAAFNATTRFNLEGFGVFTNGDGEMVLYATQKWSLYSANPTQYQYVIPDLSVNDGTRNNLHIIDMIVPPEPDAGSALVDFYVDGILALNDVSMEGTTFSAGAVEFGDCCGGISDVEWAIEWMKVEGGVTTPHEAPEIPPPLGGVAGDYNGNGTVDAADYVLWRNGEQNLQNDSTSGNQPEDFGVWRANFGKVPTGAATGATLTAVPEPTTAGLILVAGLLLATVRRK